MQKAFVEAPPGGVVPHTLFENHAHGITLAPSNFRVILITNYSIRTLSFVICVSALCFFVLVSLVLCS